MFIEELIDDVQSAIVSPYYSLYLGRRSAPPTFDLLLGVFEQDAINLLREYPWQASAWYQKKNSGRLNIYADESLLSGKNIRIRNDGVFSFSQIRGRKFSPRKEVNISVDLLKVEDHDAYDAIGEN